MKQRRPHKPSAPAGRGGKPGKPAAHKPSGQPPGRKIGKIDLFGVHAVRAAWDNPKRCVHALYITEQALAGFDPATPSAQRPAPTVVPREDLDRALPPGTVHQGIALCCQPLEETGVTDLIIAGEQKARSLLVVLDQVTDPHNIGAIMRSACAFGADGLILQRKHAPEMNGPAGGIIAKTASGGAEHVPVAYETNLTRAIETLQEAGYFAAALDERGDPEIGKLSAYPKLVLVLGAEGPGIRRLVKEQCDLLVSLPTAGPISSLNVSNAAAVALYAACGKAAT